MAAGKAWIPWAEAVDRNTGRKYWWHRETKETTWRNPIPKCIETKANQLFQQFDKDGGGSISTEELGGALGELDIRISENQLGLLLLRYDEDKSGELDCEEWMALVRDAVSAAGGNPDLKSLMQFYARRMPLKDVKRAKGYPDPPSRVCCAGDEDGCAVWWTPPEDRVNTKPPLAYIVKRYRKETDGSWTFKGETEFASAACSQRIEEMKPKSQYRFTVTTVNELGRSVDSEPSNVARRDEKLPEAWSEHYDEGSQKYYYFNKISGARSWVRPDNDPLYVDTEVFIQFTPEEMANLRKVYVEVDYDYSGAINRAELESILPKLGERLYQRDIDWLYFHCDDDQSGELDFQEFVRMLLRLKKEKMARKGFKERMKDKKTALKEWKDTPKIGAEKLQKFVAEPTKKMGVWNKIYHPTVGKCYYHNTETGAVEWLMPDEIKFFISRELNDSLMETFDPAHILEFEEKFALIDIDHSGCIDKHEFKQLLFQIGEKVSDSRVESLMHDVDQDGSGEIDFDEFCLMMQAHHGKGGTLGRLATRIEKEDSASMQRMRDEMEKLKKEIDRITKKFMGKKKFPHGKYCYCGCRAYDPAPVKKTTIWWLCCCGCWLCRRIFCKCCYSLFYCCCCFCNAFKPEKPYFDIVPEVDLQRREALVKRTEDHEAMMAEKAAKARGTDEDGQIVQGQPSNV